MTGQYTGGVPTWRDVESMTHDQHANRAALMLVNDFESPERAIGHALLTIYQVQAELLKIENRRR